eukprot:TRINITY_DN3213_c1_g1_i1.p1 TRINITY_DN3213_c1_g1~~TRINITY_DN3213_c1_g1_i1.p1  ORF type:complete len:679 (+),score=73.05 TRINITY_DN3213_c1_g1_i1:201-2237(+)
MDHMMDHLQQRKSMHSTWSDRTSRTKSRISSRSSRKSRFTLTDTGGLTLVSAAAASMEYTRISSLSTRDPQADAALERTLDRIRSRQKSPDTMGSVRTELTLELPSDLLRGVYVHHMLAGLGRHFDGSEATDDDYELSMPLDAIDDFISHDWQTPRLPKILALYFVYNYHAACICSCVAAVVAHLLQTSLQVGPFGVTNQNREVGCWAIWAGSATYLVLLVFWQRWRACMRLRKRNVFLDKLCIHQSDGDKKVQSILGIGAFLKHSQRLVVLWSPRYLTRLWCTYELATWQHLARCFESSVKFVPVAYATTLSIATFGAIIFLNILVFLGQPFLLIIPYFLVLIHFLRRSSRDVHEVWPQLSRFSVKRASCYCCTHNHRNPDTEEVILCDRTLVIGALASRFPDATNAENIDERLDEYDEEVREELLEALEQHLVVDLKYRDAISCCLPVFWRICDYIMPWAYQGMDVFLDNVCVWLILLLCIYPSALGLAVRVTSMCPAEPVRSLRSGLLELLKASLCGLAGCLPSYCMWFAWVSSRGQLPIWGAIAMPVVLILITAAVYSRSIRGAVRTLSHCIVRRRPYAERKRSTTRSPPRECDGHGVAQPAHAVNSPRAADEGGAFPLALETKGVSPEANPEDLVTIDCDVDEPLSPTSLTAVIELFESSASGEESSSELAEI